MIIINFVRYGYAPLISVVAADSDHLKKVIKGYQIMAHAALFIFVFICRVYHYCDGRAIM